MIQLIATDMDGSLLNSRKELPPRFPALLKALHMRGIRFAVSSGRQYTNLLGLFPDLADELIFIAENGAVIFILCGTKAAYIGQDQDPDFARMFYTSLEILEDLFSVFERDQVCKIAVFCENAEHSLYPILRRYETKYKVCLSGDSWVDLMMPEVSKGSALRCLQERYAIPPENCMAFGDYLNDLEMMQACGESCAMGNPRWKAFQRGFLFYSVILKVLISKGLIWNAIVLPAIASPISFSIKSHSTARANALFQVITAFVRQL